MALTESTPITVNELTYDVKPYVVAEIQKLLAPYQNTARVADHVRNAKAPGEAKIEVDPKVPTPKPTTEPEKPTELNPDAPPNGNGDVDGQPNPDETIDQPGPNESGGGTDSQDSGDMGLTPQ